MADFMHVTDLIYRSCPQYVPDLETDIREQFDLRTNPGLEFSEVQPFLALRDGKAVGRIVGVINSHANDKWNTRNVRFSMIEFIDDLQVSKALTDAVMEWGRERGMECIHGPLGITDFDKEGMLVEDFDLIGSMNTIYNHPYYPRHMEQLGFTKEVDWVQVHVDMPENVPPRFARIAAVVRERMGLRVIKLTDNAITHQGLGHKIFQLLNEAYAPLFGFSAFSDGQIDFFVKKYLRLIDKRLMPVVVNRDGEIVGVAITMGSLNHAMQKTHGRLWPTGWMHLLRAVKWRHEDGVEMLLVAVHPRYQGKGVNALFFDDLIPIYNDSGFRWAETGPQLENNMKELSQWDELKPKYIKRRRCYTLRFMPTAAR
jgi:GNAT superfamily N-acetyltransferase